MFDPPGRAVLEAEAAKIANRRGRFWQIAGPEGQISHLWGTFHSSDPLILDLPDAVRAAIAGARVIAVEVDYVLKSREAYRDAQLFDGWFKDPSDAFNFDDPGDGRIADLPLEISDWIRDRAFEAGYTEDADLILSKGGLVSMLLADPCEDFAGGVLPIQDDYVQLLGRLAGAQILGLETQKEFLDDLNAPGAEATADAIIAVYAAYLKPVTSNAERATWFGLYREGRLGLMTTWDAAYLSDVLGEKGEDARRRTEDYLITARNLRFMERLAGELSEGGVFIAVGAGHLPGDEGLVSMLRAEGYDVTRLPLPGEAE